MEYLGKVIEALKKLIDDGSRNANYHIPAYWIDPKWRYKKGVVEVNPQIFFQEQIEKIISLGQHSIQEESERLSDQIVYNMFVRYAAAFDHNADGNISKGIVFDGFRETGTFLKAISMLPYIHSLGTSIIYLLPISSIGKDGKKGTLGSPYAIKNPYKIDETLNEPILGLDSEQLFAAFVEAAHILKLKVVVEFVFRTASRDSELAIERPKWFYWIDSEIEDKSQEIGDKLIFTPPTFDEDELALIKSKVEHNDFKELPKPGIEYISMFTDSPRKLELMGERITGVLPDNRRCRIPGAFADWPPDDKQPVWSDVTYLRLYDHPDYNYMAYNTVRMYDEELSKRENAVEELWLKISSIIPFYQHRYKIDGVMIDMGHALPAELRAEIVRKGRLLKKNFIFWEENFVLSQKSADEGYDAVVGYLPFDEHLPAKMKELIRRLSEEGSPVPFFATPENHNTPRAVTRYNNLEFSVLAWTVNCFLPAIPFIHSGFEMGEIRPINTGLDFSTEIIAEYPPEKLPLFSEAAMKWNTDISFISKIRGISNLRKKYLKGMDNDSYQKIEQIKTSHPDVVGFVRSTNDSNLKIAIVFSLNPKEPVYTSMEFEIEYKELYNIHIKSKRKIVNKSAILNLNPFEVCIFEIRA